MTKRKMLPGSYETDIEPNKAPLYTSENQAAVEKKSAKAIARIA